MSNPENDKNKGQQDAGFSAARRGMLKTATGVGVAAVAAPFLGAGIASADPQFPRGNSPSANNLGFPRAKDPNAIWSLDYAGNLWPGLRNGPALYAMFFPATGIYVESNGTIKVADARNSVIRNVSNLGDVTTFSGSVQQYPFKDGAATVATYNSPNDIDKLSNGDYVVGDRENNAIRLVRADGSVVTIAGQGNCKNRFNGDQTDARNAQLNRPLTLGVTSESTGWHTQDTVYFADRDNFLIRKLV
ncbi:MAG: hypothetical protein IV085_05510, partial [Thiobacillus sp.]|nr:hypothetical protein [Thiobacillus sp.]